MGSSSKLSTWLIAGAFLSLTACADESFVMPTRVEITAQHFTVSGIITEMTPDGVRPSAGASVWGQGANVGTVGDPFRTPYTITDGQGRYSFSDLTYGTNIQLQLYKGGYFQQCAVPVAVVGGGNLSVLDGQVVAAEMLSASPTSVPTQRLGYRFVAGTVYRAGGREPAAGVTVGYGWEESYMAATRTDAMGRYLLCGLPEKSSVGIEALGPDTGADVDVPPGPSATGVDLVFWR